MNEEELLQQYAAALERSLADFRAKGSKRMGFGKRPAVLVVDMHRGATARHERYDAEVEATRALLDVTRAHGIPSFFASNEIHHRNELGLFGEKAPEMMMMYAGSEWNAIDPRLDLQPNEHVFNKIYPSCFFGTDLASRLAYRGVDTVLVTGLTTSGCVRATTVDCMQHGFRPMLIRECVNDRMPFAHLGNLYDLELKYADVISLTEAIDYVQGLGESDEVAVDGQVAV